MKLKVWYHLSQKVHFNVVSVGADGVLPPEGSDTSKNALGNVQNAGKVPGTPSPSGEVGSKSQVTSF